jgi:hypothetical protein
MKLFLPLAELIYTVSKILNLKFLINDCIGEAVTPAGGYLYRKRKYCLFGKSFK